MKEKNSPLSNLIDALKKPTRILSLVASVGLISVHPIVLTIKKMEVSSQIKCLIFGLDVMGYALLVYSCKELCWRIKKEEYAVVLPVIFLYACSIFIYTSSRIAKNSMVIGVKDAEQTASIKLMVPLLSTAYHYFYTKIIKKIKLSSLIYITIIPLVLFMSIISLYCVGNLGILPSDAYLANLEILINKFWTFGYGIGHFVSFMLRYVKDMITAWPQTLFYLFSEIFATFGLASYSIQILNSQVEKHQSKRVFPLLSLISQFPALTAAFINYIFSVNIISTIYDKAVLATAGGSLTHNIRASQFTKISQFLSQKNDPVSNKNICDLFLEISTCTISLFNKSFLPSKIFCNISTVF